MCRSTTLRNSKFKIQPFFGYSYYKPYQKSILYVFNVIKVLLVTMVTISGLYSHTQKSSENCIYALAVTRKRQVAPERLLQTRSTFTKSVSK